MGIGKIARRTFLIGSAAIAGGVAIGYYYVSRPYANPLEDELAEGEATFNPYVKIAEDNTITIITPRAEMGQGIHTTLAAMVAEELDVSLEQVNVEHGPADGAYHNTAMLAEGGPFPFFEESFTKSLMAGATATVSKVFGLQVTGGSSSTTDAFEKMRHSGCAARHMMIAAAASEWGVSADSLTTENGEVIDPATGNRKTYGELAAKASGMDAPSKIVLKDKKDWKLLGKSPQRVDIPAKVTGQPVFGIDVDLPEMVHATVRMSPRFWAKSKSHDDTAALKVPGVVKIVPIEMQTGHGFGIIAENTWAAFKGAEALEVDWEEAAYPGSNEAIFTALGERLNQAPEFSLRDDGDVQTAFADAPREDILEVEYQVPYLAHACMEPMNATAQWKDGVLEIWAPNQAPTIIQMVVAPLVGVEPEAVKVNTTMLGGGFGRRAEVDFVLYAVEMAKHTDGKPVKVTWTREEDTRHDTYRPASVGRFRALVKTGELPEAVDMHIAAPPLMKSVMKRTFPSLNPAGPDKPIVEGSFDQPYKIPNYRVSGSPVDIDIPIGFWRSVGNSQNGFFHEGFMDEVAEKAAMDPLDMRLKLMADYPAATGVLKQVAEMSGWGYELPEGRGMGIAHTLSFGAWVAEVIQVKNGEYGIEIEKVWCAAEMGEVLDPSIVKAQMMSGIVFGLSSAIGQEINFENGEVQEGNFDAFSFMSMAQCPEIEIELLETYHKMGGAGEPGMPPAVPALANAVYKATGKRIRKLPMWHEVDFA